MTPSATYNYAGTLMVLGRYAEAEPLFEETIRTATARHEQRTQFDAMIELGGLYVERGDLPRAAAQLARLTPLFDDPQFDTLRHALLDYYTGRLAQTRGDEVAARTHFVKAADFFDAHDFKLAVNVSTAIDAAVSVGSTLTTRSRLS